MRCGRRSPGGCPARPGLSMRLGEIDGEPWWVPDPQVDVTAHVVEAPAGRGRGRIEAGFRALVAGIFAQHLDRSRPLWRIDVIPRLAGGGSALIWRIHHALADGMTAMRMASAVLWDEEAAAAPRTARSRTRRRAPRAARPAAHHRLATLLAAAREVPQPWLRSPFDGHIDGRRSVAFTATRLDELHRVAAASGRRDRQRRGADRGGGRAAALDRGSSRPPRRGPGEGAGEPAHPAAARERATPSRATAIRSSASTCPSGQPTRWSAWPSSGTPP